MKKKQKDSDSTLAAKDDIETLNTLDNAIESELSQKREPSPFWNTIWN